MDALILELIKDKVNEAMRVHMETVPHVGGEHTHAGFASAEHAHEHTHEDIAAVAEAAAEAAEEAAEAAEESAEEVADDIEEEEAAEEAEEAPVEEESIEETPPAMESRSEEAPRETRGFAGLMNRRVFGGA